MMYHLLHCLAAWGLIPVQSIPLPTTPELKKPANPEPVNRAERRAEAKRQRAEDRAFERWCRNNGYE